MESGPLPLPRVNQARYVTSLPCLTQPPHHHIIDLDLLIFTPTTAPKKKH
jgi:hypothetical protein